jgi:hypothetical protein
MCASWYGFTDTARTLVAHGASLEAVEKVNIHAHVLANTCCMKHVCLIAYEQEDDDDELYECIYM